MCRMILMLPIFPGGGCSVRVKNIFRNQSKQEKQIFSLAMSEKKYEGNLGTSQDGEWSGIIEICPQCFG